MIMAVALVLSFWTETINKQSHVNEYQGMIAGDQKLFPDRGMLSIAIVLALGSCRPWACAVMMEDRLA